MREELPESITITMTGGYLKRKREWYFTYSYTDILYNNITFNAWIRIGLFRRDSRSKSIPWNNSLPKFVSCWWAKLFEGRIKKRKLITTNKQEIFILCNSQKNYFLRCFFPVAQFVIDYFCCCYGCWVNTRMEKVMVHNSDCKFKPLITIHQCQVRHKHRI